MRPPDASVAQASPSGARMTGAVSPGKSRAPGWWYPWIFVVGMLVVVAVNGVLFTFAISTFSGLQTEDAYRKGIAYNDALAGAREQAQRGWQAEIDHAGARVRVRLTDAVGAGLDGLDVVVDAIRPVQAGHDLQVRLDPVGNGVYGGALALPFKGVWDLRVSAAGGAAGFQTVKRISVP
jgi:nitrogen fixation protein FixH